MKYALRLKWLEKAGTRKNQLERSKYIGGPHKKEKKLSVLRGHEYRL